VARPQRGTAGVEGQRPDVCRRPAGRRVTGQALLTHGDWPGRDRCQRPGLREARLMATSPTVGSVTVVIVAAPGPQGDARRCQATTRTAPGRIRAWQRRRWSAHHGRTRTHVWATEACPVPGEDVDDGHLVWRLWAGLGLRYTARRRCKGRVPRAAIGCSLQHHWRFLTSKDLVCPGLSWGLSLEAA